MKVRYGENLVFRLIASVNKFVFYPIGAVMCNSDQCLELLVQPNLPLVKSLGTTQNVH